MYTTYHALMTAYLESLKNRPAYGRTVRVASQWILIQSETPTRAQIIARMEAKGKGDFQPGCQQANKELAIQRAAFRWGLYHGTWEGGDPTAGIRKFKTKKRKTVAKHLEIRALLDLFSFAETDTDLRNRALFGICLMTGCRPSEARTATVEAITPYGQGGCWKKGTTKTGEDQELPIPRQAMEWVNAWRVARDRQDRYQHSPWLFPGLDPQEPLSEAAMRLAWSQIRAGLNMGELWNYDLRRTLASTMSNELGESDKRIQAILNHSDGTALSHYLHVTFDALVPVMQLWEDHLFSLQGEPHHETPPPQYRAPRHRLRPAIQA